MVSVCVCVTKFNQSKSIQSQWENPASFKHLFLNATTTPLIHMIHNSNPLWTSTQTPWTFTQRHTQTHTSQRPSNLLVMRKAKSCSFPLGATIIEGRIWATAANKWLGSSWSAADLDLNIMTRMMKLTQNHQLPRAESDSGLTLYDLCAYEWHLCAASSSYICNLCENKELRCCF